MPLTFTKEERLCSQKLIDRLYADGHRMMAYPYSVRWLARQGQADAKAPCQVLIVAPKRRFHHAVDRNHARRLTRECWRQLKPQLYEFLEGQGISLVLSLVYVNNEIMPYDKLLPKMEKLVQQLEKEILENGEA